MHHQSQLARREHSAAHSDTGKGGGIYVAELSGIFEDNRECAGSGVW